MTDASAKVSAHYMVEEDGRIFQLVEEDKRAWHAGVSEWRGETNINSASIGIEIVNRDRGVAIVQRGLAEIGYSARVTGVIDEETRLVVAAFQRRYRPAQIDGMVDMETMAIVRWLVEGPDEMA